MKALKIIGLVIFGLVALFFALGLFLPTVSYTTEITVDKPADQAWTVFTDEELMFDWMTGLVEVKLIEGEKMQVGNKTRFVFEENGELMEAIEIITAIRENEEFSFDMDAEPLTSENQILFKAIGDNQTTISQHSVVRGKNLLWKSVMVLFRGQMEKTSTEMYDRLAALINAYEPPVPEPDSLVEELELSVE